MAVEVVAGGSVVSLSVSPSGNGTGSPGLLNDGAWHAASVSLTPSFASLTLDHDPEEAAVKTGPLLIIPELGGDWSVGGGGEDGRGGFLGSIRRVSLGDAPGLNLPALAEVPTGCGEGCCFIGGERAFSQGVSGVEPGLGGACSAESCANGGCCRDYYDHFSCDCDETPFQGARCQTGLVSFCLGRLG